MVAQVAALWQDMQAAFHDAQAALQQAARHARAGQSPPCEARSFCMQLTPHCGCVQHLPMTPAYGLSALVFGRPISLIINY